jgi:hypothetical protein
LSDDGTRKAVGKPLESQHLPVLRNETQQTIKQFQSSNKSKLIILKLSCFMPMLETGIEVRTMFRVSDEKVESYSYIWRGKNRCFFAGL